MDLKSALQAGIMVLATVSLSTAGHSDEAIVTNSFPAEGVDQVILRAANAETAIVVSSEDDRPIITVSGKATGGTLGYHSADRNWKETPASEWGMRFVSKRIGSMLIVSTENEIRYIHHNYTIESISIQLPKELKLLRITRQPGGSGEPDLRAP